MKISVVIITFNEQKNIRRCLDSVSNVADEIIIVDSFSTDDTSIIAAEYDVKFIKHKFEGHIEQKNYALSLCSYSYVLSLDADESLSENLKAEILKIKRNPKSDAYFFNRLTFYNSKAIKHGGWYPDKKIRLWDKRKGKWGGVNPHDKVILDKDSSVSYIQGDLLHFSFSSIEEHIGQINKFSTIKAEGDFAKQKKVPVIKLLFSPLAKFFIMYFLKMGFLDGFYGFIVCINSAHSNFLKYAKLQELNKNERNTN